MIDSSMLPDFIIEAAEHLEEMENSLLRLEQHQEEESKEIMDSIFRSVHTIKGAAQFVGIDRVSELSHKFENLLDLIRKGELTLSEPVIDLLIEGKDRITLLVDELERNQVEESEVGDLLEKIRIIVDGEVLAVPEAAAESEELLIDSLQLEQDVAAPEPDSQKTKEGSLAEEILAEEHDEELYSIFLQQLKENIPFLYAQTVELSISVDKQDVLYRCSDSIKSLKSSANYMGYEKLARHYSDWQKAISNAVDQLSSGKMPDLAFMQDYIDEIIRSFPQAMEGYSQEDTERRVESGSNQKFVENALDSIFSDEAPASASPPEEPTRDLDFALDSIFSDEAPAGAAESDDQKNFGRSKKTVSLEYELSEDEYDQELVTIFLKKLKTDIRFIQDQVAELATAADKEEVLERCSNAIGKLASSANYMEYLSLTAYCEEWQQVVADYTTKLSEGLDPDFGQLHVFIDEIIRVYPQIAESEQQKEHELKAAVGKDDAVENTADIVSSLLSPSAVKESTEHKSATEKMSTVPDGAEAVKTGIEESKEDPELSQEEQDLFVRLSNALELSMSHETGAGAPMMDGVIESIIDPSNREDAAEEALSAPKDLNQGRVKSAQAEAEEEFEEFSVLVSPQAIKVEESELGIEEEVVEEHEVMLDEDDDFSEDDSLPKVKSTVKKTATRSSIRVDAEKIDYLMNQVGELVVSRAYFAQLVNEMKGLQQLLQEKFKLAKNELKPLHEFAFRLNEAGIHLGRVSNELQEGVMKVRMLPIDQLFKRFPRLVRDLVHRTDKDVRLVTKGEETELDKMVIEFISDPLIHIIRNAVDHGIESVQERKLAGKPAQGTLLLEAFHESDHIVLEISDDGRGIDPKRIKAKALEKGLFRKDELNRMSELDLHRIIMQPGFSTAEKTTETSGRGVGMDVVKRNIERLNGIVEISSKVGEGTRLRIKIPLTMAIIQALMVRVGKEKFTIPLTTVEETLRIFRHEISEIEGVDVIHIRDITMPIFKLSKIYDIDREAINEEKMFVVVVSTGTQEVGLVVDELLGQEEVVIKPLADYLKAESGFGGATILGDGGISLILDIPELVKIASENQANRQEERAKSYKRSKRRKRNVGTVEEQSQSVH